MLKPKNNVITTKLQERLNLKRPSARAYASLIRRLFNETKQTGDLNLRFLDSDRVVTHLKSIANVGTRKNLASAALAGARAAKMSQARQNSIRVVMMSADADYKRFMSSGSRNKGFTGKAAVLWKELRNLHKKVGRVITAKQIFRRAQHPFEDIQTLQFFVYCKLLHFYEPRRLEYSSLRFLTPGKLALFTQAEQNKLNYVLMGTKKWKLVYNNYKTSRTYGSQSYDIPPGLKTTLRKVHAIFEPLVPAGWVYFTKNKRPMSHSTFSKFLKTMFKTYTGKNWTQNVVRSIRVSALFKDAPATQQLLKTQKDMGSKLETLALNYRVPQ